MAAPPRKPYLTGEQFLAALNRGIADGAPARRALENARESHPRKWNRDRVTRPGEPVTWGCVDEFLARHGGEKQ